MTITIADLETKYAAWFLGVKNTEYVKQEILALFQMEPDEEHTWSEQDIFEQARKIIRKWNDIENHENDLMTNRP